MTKHHEPTKPAQLSEEAREKAWAYARGYYPDAEHSGRPGRGILEDFQLLSQFVPDVMPGYFQLRQGAFDTGPNAALDRKTKELLLVAMGLASRKTNPPPLGHTRLAIEAGATVAEIAEIVSLCIFYCGIISFDEGGRHVLRAAAEFAAGRDAEAGSATADAR